MGVNVASAMGFQGTLAPTSFSSSSAHPGGRFFLLGDTLSETVVEEISSSIVESRRRCRVTQPGPTGEASHPTCVTKAVRCALREGTYSIPRRQADAQPMTLPVEAAVALDRARHEGRNGSLGPLPKFSLPAAKRAKTKSGAQAALRKWMASKECSEWRMQRKALFAQQVDSSDGESEG